MAGAGGRLHPRESRPDGGSRRGYRRLSHREARAEVEHRVLRLRDEPRGLMDGLEDAMRPLATRRLYATSILIYRWFWEESWSGFSSELVKIAVTSIPSNKKRIIIKLTCTCVQGFLE